MSGDGGTGGETRNGKNWKITVKQKSQNLLNFIQIKKKMELPINEIKTMADVKKFARHIIIVEDVNVHPDNDFGDYVAVGESEDDSHTYTEKEVELRNNLMNECFKVCQENGEDIYEVFYNIFESENLN